MRFPLKMTCSLVFLYGGSFLFFQCFPYSVVLRLSFSVSVFWTASSIWNSVTYCRYDNQNTLTTMTAGTQGTRGRLISHVHSIAKVAPSQGCVKITEYRPLPEHTNSSQSRSGGYPQKHHWQLERPLRTLLIGFSTDWVCVAVGLCTSAIFQQRVAEGVRESNG